MLHKWKELVNVRAIRGKFFLLTTSLIVIPMVIVSLIFYLLTAQKLSANATNHATASLRMAELYMDRAINEVGDLANVILGNQEIQSILANPAADDFEYIRNVDKLSKIMNVYTQAKPYISSYLIYVKNGSANMHFYRGSASVQFGSRIVLDAKKAEIYYNQLLHQNTIMWINQNPFDEVSTEANSHRMFVCKLLKRTEGNYDDLGFVMLEIDKDAFFKGLLFLNPTEQSQFFILNEQGQVLYRMPQPDPDSGGSAANLLTRIDLGGGQTTLDGKTYLSASVDNERTRWKLMNIIEDSKLYEDANEIGTLTIRIFLVVLIIGWLAALKLGNSISRPLNRLRSMIVANQYAHARQKRLFNPNDEVGQIGEKFITMMEENTRLHEEIYDMLRQRMEAQIEVLQAQINPHFLYNTLESLNGLAVSSDQQQMSEVIGALGKFFRITLSKGNELITVADELEHVSAYVKVQKFRFKDKFEWICEVDEAVKPFYVPKLIMQPIVENAIYHGLKGRPGTGMIMVSAELEGHVLTFRVTDDGEGIPEERLHDIFKALNEGEKGKVYGIKNVHDQLRLRFGAGFGIGISTEKGKYTTVSVTVPAISSQQTATYDRRSINDDQSYDRRR